MWRENSIFGQIVTSSESWSVNGLCLAERCEPRCLTIGSFGDWLSRRFFAWGARTRGTRASESPPFWPQELCSIHFTSFLLMLPSHTPVIWMEWTCFIDLYWRFEANLHWRFCMFFFSYNIMVAVVDDLFFYLNVFIIYTFFFIVFNVFLNQYSILRFCVFSFHFLLMKKLSEVWRLKCRPLQIILNVSHIHLENITNCFFYVAVMNLIVLVWEYKFSRSVGFYRAPKGKWWWEKWYFSVFVLACKSLSECKIAEGNIDHFSVYLLANVECWSFVTQCFARKCKVIKVSFYIG